jgi:hypothetical protein
MIRIGRLLLAMAGAALAQAASSAPPPGPASHGVAVIELFTSEGCSSCPPADALLERFVGDAQRSGQPVYGLSFHVDYWDHLGWKDRYSSAAYSQRQSRYARRLGLGSLYTPQMIVNGTREFVGSNRAAADAAIREALANAAPARIRLSASVQGHEVAVKYAVEGRARRSDPRGRVGRRPRGIGSESRREPGPRAAPRERGARPAQRRAERRARGNHPGHEARGTRRRGDRLGPGGSGRTRSRRGRPAGAGALNARRTCAIFPLRFTPAGV